jgi:prepilin-type N-terminal cleavage/methylation domain-containing protein
MTCTRPSPARDRAGFTFVELAVVMTILLSALLIFSSTVSGVAKQRSVNRETGLAVSAARNLLETLRSEDFGEVFALYNADPADDPGGPGSAPGHRFAVAGLDEAPDSLDGLEGEVVFPTAWSAGGALELREDLEIRALGLPRDLSGDGKVDDQDHSAGYFILPVQVRLRWKGATGVRQFELASQLCRYVKT